MGVTVLNLDYLGKPLTWRVDGYGAIVSCTPAGPATLWEGRKVHNISTLQEGELVKVASYKGKPVTLKFIVVSINYE